MLLFLKIIEINLVIYFFQGGSKTLAQDMRQMHIHCNEGNKWNVEILSLTIIHGGPTTSQVQDLCVTFHYNHCYGYS